MERKITVENHEIGLKASAGTVRRYRVAFAKDLLTDMGELEADIIATQKLSPNSVGIAEQVAWIMAKEYDPDIPEMEEWLEQFSPYFTFFITPFIITMWRDNLRTLNESKKS